MASTSVEVTLPFNSLVSLTRITSAILRRREYEHELLILDTFNHNSSSLDLRTGDPVGAVLKGHSQMAEGFVGYIHNVRSTVKREQPRSFRIVCVGATWVMKDQKQRVWANTTISTIARTILREHNLTADIEDHPTVIPQMMQAGESDWAFLCRIAKDFGYVCYPTGTVVHFHSRLRRLTQKQRSAVVLDHQYGTLGQRSPVHEFKPTLADTPETGKSRLTLRNVDPRTGQEWAYGHDGSPPVSTRLESRAAIFGEILSGTVANSPGEAQTRLQGVQNQTLWNHQATAVLDGYSGVQPTSVMYLRSLKGNYDGYWNVVGVDHIYNNRDAYRMECILGTNDLGPPLATAAPGALVKVDTDKLPVVAPAPQLVFPGGLSTPDLLAARGGPSGVRWRGSVADVDPPPPTIPTPWFIRRKHRYVGR